MNPNKTDAKTVINLKSSKDVNNKIKITLPGLSNYDDDDDNETDEDEKEAASMVINRAANVNTTFQRPATGLLSVLPQPKVNQFINKSKSATNVQPSTSDSTSKLLMPRTLLSNVSKKPNSVLDEDDAIRQRNFKRFKNEDQNSVVVGRNLQPKKFIADYKDFETKDPEIKFNDDNDNEESDDNNDENEEDEQEFRQQIEQKIERKAPELNQEALMKLCGKKHSKEAIELMNVKANDIIGDNRSGLMKQITKEYKPATNKDYFGSGSKRTHHINYLAMVAKERDQELRESWAQNKFNKTQARQKYGF
jgi:hypothetical protein